MSPRWKDALIKVATMRRFAGSAVINDPIPHETMLLAFWHLLARVISAHKFFK